MLELRIHGRGGQGLVTMAELLAKAAVKAGKEAQTLPFFGVERRGAAVKACVRIDDAPIKIRSMSYHPQAVALMAENMLPFAKAEGYGEDSFFIVNHHEPIKSLSQWQWSLDAEKVAYENNLVFGGEPFINVPMLGAIARAVGVPLACVEEAIREQWKGAKAEPNLKAVRQAYAAVECQRWAGGKMEKKEGAAK